MDEKLIRSKLGELAEIVAALPTPSENKPSKGAYLSHALPMSAKSNEELIDHIRLQVKYILFDLEATRRENRYLRQMLERRSNFGEGPDQT